MILAAAAFPIMRDALIRAQTAKAQTDVLAIEKALNLYHIDYMEYPSTQNSAMSNSQSVDRMHVLTTPIAYISPLPFVPWYGKKGLFYYDGMQPASSDFEPQYKIQGNYAVWVTTISNYLGGKTNGPLPDWSIDCGGPLSICSSPSPRYWYSPTNGLLSIGGIWRDSDGNNSFNR